MGMGNKPNKADPITEKDEEKLWNSGALGHHSPKALRNSIWYLTTKCFGLRGRQEARTLKWGDLEIKQDDEGEKYVQFSERQTKTRQGDNKNERAFPPKMWQNKTNPTRCPIFLLNEYARHRPHSMCHDDAPFYLVINYKRLPDSECWYSRMPMGRNELGKIMRECAKRAELTGKVTNHSVRKTCCSNLIPQGSPQL